MTLLVDLADLNGLVRGALSRMLVLWSLETEMTQRCEVLVSH